MPSLLLHKSAVRRDQVFLSSNEGGCLITYPPFVIYKPDPYSLNVHLRLAPSHWLCMSIFVQLFPCQSSNESNGASPSRVVKIWVRSVECLSLRSFQ